LSGAVLERLDRFTVEKHNGHTDKITVTGHRIDTVPHRKLLPIVGRNHRSRRVAQRDRTVRETLNRGLGEHLRFIPVHAHLAMNVWSSNLGAIVKLNPASGDSWSRNQIAFFRSLDIAVCI
jgi:hypothetical protein